MERTTFERGKDMDELKLTLSTKFMKGVVAKLIRAAIYKKLGYDINIELNDIRVTAEDGKIHIHADVDGEMTNEEFIRILKSIGS